MRFEMVDKYVIKARVMPVGIALLPWAAAVAPWLATDFNPTAVGSSFGLMALAAYALSHVSRRSGKAAEASLRAKWKSHPTAKFLRWIDPAIDDSLKLQIHQRLATFTGIPSPTRAEEESKQSDSDAIYKGYAERLRAYALSNRTDPNFTIVHAENIDYGFVRNLYGLRWWLFLGIGVATISLYFAYRNELSIIVGSVLFGVACLAAFNARESSVLSSSDNYGLRLLDASLYLPTEKS